MENSCTRGCSVDERGSTLTGPRMRLPWDVVELIVEEAWRDTSLHDHTPLYGALAQTCAYLRQRLACIAWRYTFVRSAQDFRLYLHLRFGDILHDSDRTNPHAELNVAVVWLQPLSVLRKRASPPAHVLDGWSGPLLRKIRPEVIAQTDLYDLDAPADLSVVAPAKLVRIYPWRDTVVLQNAVNWLRALLAPPPQGFTLVLRNVSPLLQGHGAPLPYVAHVVLDLADEPHHAKQWDTWVSTRTSVRSLFPRLNSLAIFGRFCERPMAPYPLPSSLRSLVLEVKPGRDAPTVDAKGLNRILENEFDVDEEGKPNVCITLLTSTDELEGWSEAVKTADEKNITLERRIVSWP